MTTTELYTQARAIRSELTQRLRSRAYARVSTDARWRAVGLVRQARQAGVRWHVIGAALGVDAKKLQRWCSEAIAEDGCTDHFEAVQVVTEIAPAQPSDRCVGVLTLVTPSGVRVEGLTTTDAITVLRALG